MLKTTFLPYQLQLKRPSGTSRGVLTTKDTWVVKVWDDARPDVVGIGECALFKGLSCDDTPDYEAILQSLTPHLPPVDELFTRLKDYPSILFGFETALADLENGGQRIIFPSDFAQGNASIQINGLIWMGSKEQMKLQIREKIEQGFSCLKLKIGAIDFEAELELLKSIRKEFNANDIELRVDANGAFSVDDALVKLDTLSKLDLHSIEQPIRAGQWELMRKLCNETPLPIALDEELIGVNDLNVKKELLSTIRPQYIILKPSLHGGFHGSEEWIQLAETMQIKWWATSALESNIGLNAIAQWCATHPSPLPQGLGTGQLYTNNFESPLTLTGDQLAYNVNGKWEINI